MATPCVHGRPTNSTGKGGDTGRSYWFARPGSDGCTVSADGPAAVPRRSNTAYTVSRPNRFVNNLPSASTRGRAGGITRNSTTHGFFPSLMTQTFGQDRLSAVLSGIAPGTRTKYLTAWRHWEKFVTGRQMSPWIWRVSPDWGDNLIDYIMFETKVVAPAPNTVSGEISGIRFWHLLVGMPDFTLGGGRYTQLLKSCRRGSRANRIIPVTLEMLPVVTSQQRRGGPTTLGIACAALVGFSSFYEWLSWGVCGGRTLHCSQTVMAMYASAWIYPDRKPTNTTRATLNG